MAMTMHIDIVSAEQEIYSGTAEMVFAPLVNGEYDHLPEQAFYMVGTIEEAVEKAKTL